MKCFYHSADLDGHCSGAIVKYFNPECEMIGINYGQEFPWDSIEFGETVYMVDFSLEPFELMEELNRLCDHYFIWIDHHKTAIELDNKLQKEKCMHIPGIRQEEGKAACELTWEHFSSKPVPKGVSLLSKYDIWDHKDPNVLPFQYGMRNYNTNPDNQHMWGCLFEYEDKAGFMINNFVQEGIPIVVYIINDDKRYINAHHFVIEFEGYTCLAVNRLDTNSYIFSDVWNPKNYDLMLTFGWNKNKWAISLYSEGNINVGEIAKKYGGGGHHNAAGFSVKELPFKL